MNCAGFERWLDEGMEAAEEEAALAHAASCPGCARASEALRIIEDFLRGPLPAVPGSFTRIVMERIAGERASARRRWRPMVEPGLPLWVRFLAEPATVLAFFLVALLGGWGGQIAEGVDEGIAFLLALELPDIIGPSLPGAGQGSPARTVLFFGLTLGAVPVLSVALYRAIRGLFCLCP